MKRLLALTLAFMMVFSVAAGAVSTAVAASGDDWDMAMHFIVRHWHAVDASGNSTTEDNYGTHAEPIEGWIVPNGQSFRFYAADRTTPLGANRYVLETVPSAGIVRLAVSPYVVNGENAENFAGFSVSAGHQAVDTLEDMLEIRYRKDVPLVKSHVFYQEVRIFETGSDKEKVFGWQPDKGSADPQVDTAKVYVFKKAMTWNDAEHEAGDIPTHGDGMPFVEGEEEELKATGLQIGVDVSLEKVYSTLEGLHTDKTARESRLYNDGRTFDIDLEAWFADAQASHVGLVLDASGSMAFTMENLEPIKVPDGVLTNKRVTAANAPQSAEEWEKLFLSMDELNANHLLNTHYTDNSLLGFSDYTYYVYDQRKDSTTTTREFVPLGYWGGRTETSRLKSLSAKYEFNQGAGETGKDSRDWLLNSITNEREDLIKRVAFGSQNVAFEKREIADDERWGSLPIKMSGSDGFVVRETKDKPEGGLGFEILQPQSKTFTLSFSIKKNTTTKYADNTDAQNQAELLYIGPGTIPGDNGFLRIIRDGGTSVSRLKGLLGWSGNAKINVNNVFNTQNVAKNITMVFSENADGTVHVKTYVDGVLSEAASDTPEADIPFTLADDQKLSIIFNGIKEEDEKEYNGAELYIDNVDLFDFALTDMEVAAIYGEGMDLDLPVGWSLAFSDDGEVLGIVDQKTTLIGGMGKAGWYYVNPASYIAKAYLNPNVQTSKSLIGFSAGNEIEVENKIDFPAYLDGALKDAEPIGVSYRPTSNGPTRFFIDGNGYLRCFFSSGTENTKTFVSYVYTNKDEDYIKTEALQRALGAFAITLNNISPASQIAAVRFSQRSFESEGSLENLVLLDWTNKTTESTNILSLHRGTGGTVKGDTSSNNGNLVQYNYGLTGGTYTSTGLKAFIDSGLAKGPAGSDDSAKYLIIFTDGKDNQYTNTSGTTHDAIGLADDLKRMGYTIYTVMLNAGSISPAENADDYELAKQFLTYMSGDYNTSSADIAAMSAEELAALQEHYVNITNDANATGGGSGSSVDRLVDIFVNKIVKEVTDNLTGYSVQDYIDPRFDLVDVDGNVWHLDTDGVVTVKTAEGVAKAVYDLKTLKEMPTIALSNAADVESKAHSAKLHFNSDEDAQQYYLVWTDQTIPGYVMGSKEITIWNARITLRAKEDFIGGNAVLTNGPGAKMNYVFDPKDKNAPSSGTERAVRDFDNNPSPSKGFPRTVVNVQMPTPSGSGSELIYMGETIDNTESILDMVKAAFASAEAADIGVWYWEYLLRYDKQYPDEKVINNLLNGDTVNIPYQYLPISEEGKAIVGYDNLTGTKAHEGDKLGTMTYQWAIQPASEGPTKDTLTRTTTLSVDYKPYDIATTDGTDRETRTNELIAEGGNNGIYEWNRAYKSEVGESKPESGRFDYVTEIVSGEIAFQMVIPEAAIAYLQALMPGQTVTYRAVLTRTYEEGGIENAPVASFTAEFPIPADPADGQVIVTVPKDKIEFTPEYAYAAQYGLPIGTYTLTHVPEETPSTLYTFSGITAVELNDTAAFEALFSRYPTQHRETAKGAKVPLTSFKALYEEGSISPELGTVNIPNTAPDYRDERYALLRVTLLVDSGNLTVSKTVVGNGDETGKTFTFTVTLSDTGVNGLVGDMEFRNGVAIFELAPGESKTANGLPAGVTYKVTESGNEGYATTSTGEEGTISSEKDAVAAFVNTRYVGGLTVNKKVEGNGGETDKAFTFTVTLSDTSVNGTYGDMAFTNGVATFTLKHNESKTATDLPDGITYTVTESGNEGYVTTSTGDKGTISSDSAAVAAFVNTRTVGSLTVSKKVAGNGGDTNKAFTFTVTLSDTSVNGTFGDMAFKNGVATFTLKHNESKTATGLPNGIAYTVTESGNEGYVTTSTGDKGTISSDSAAVAAFVNTRMVGSLTVSKKVAGNGGDTSKAFTFTVTLSDTSVNGTFCDMEFKNGVATFTLKHNESKTATGLPNSITYTVTESGNEGYVTTSTGDKGTISKDNAAVATFVNTRTVGSLTVSKKVAGNGGDTSKAFTFTVTLNDTSINGTFGDMEFKNGVATFTLKHNESKTATGLPNGITYTVTESGNEGSVTTSTGDKGTISKDNAAVAAFVNTRTVGSLTVSKKVAGNGGDTSKAFSFTVMLSDTSVNGTFGDMVFKNGVATFTLKHNESKTATGLPNGITYTVTESGNEGYVTTSTGDKGTLSSSSAAVAAFVNTRNIGSLTVSKTVSGTAGETDRAFSFMVMLSDTSVNGTYGDMTFNDGVATFTLKHNESKTAVGLPTDVRYSVVELEANQDDYTTTSVGETGSISEEEASRAIFVNSKDIVDVPQTGDESHLALWVTLLLASVLGIGFIAFRRKDSHR